jgi:hypothetical protein
MGWLSRHGGISMHTSSPALLAATFIMLGTVAVNAAAVPTAKQPIKLLVPSEDTCAAFLKALNSGDTGLTLDLGGWALGFLSGVAQASGKDILGNTTSQALMDRIGEECQGDPSKPISSVVEDLSRSLAGTSPP